MKVEVIKRFNDIETKERRNVGDVIECKKERAKLLIESGYAKEIVKEEVE